MKYFDRASGHTVEVINMTRTHVVLEDNTTEFKTRITVSPNNPYFTRKTWITETRKSK